MNQNLKLRILTALVGVPLILILLLGLGTAGVALCAWVISIGMLFEYCRMFFNLSDANRKTAYALLLATALHVLNYFLHARMSDAVIGLAPGYIFFIVFLFMVPGLLRYGGSAALNSVEGAELVKKHVQELMALCFGMVYCVWFPMLMVGIRTMQNDGTGKLWLMLGLLIVWANDTFAYFGGKLWGRRFLFETISPKKTWEGAATGVIGALIIGLLYLRIYLPGGNLVIQSILILTVSAASILGDLVESLLKRSSGKKDSGSILPGHGGFLDRFDGVVLAIPTLYALLWFFTQMDKNL